MVYNLVTYADEQGDTLTMLCCTARRAIAASQLA